MFDLSLKDTKRFWRYVPKGLSSDVCWNWLGPTYKNKDGTLRARFNYSPKINQAKNALACRIIYFLINGHYNLELLVCHKCDNQLCVNPNHLWLGTYLDNNRDCIIKCRSVNKGKLSEENVKFIRMYQLVYTNKQLAEMFNVDCSTISKIINKRKFTYV